MISLFISGLIPRGNLLVDLFAGAGKESRHSGIERKRLTNLKRTWEESFQ